MTMSGTLHPKSELIEFTYQGRKVDVVLLALKAVSEEKKTALAGM